MSYRLLETLTRPSVLSNTGPSIISFCAGANYICAVFDSKRMKCAGDGKSYGGNDTFYGDSKNEIGDNLPFVDVGTSINIDQVSCARQNICLKLDTGDVKCLGFNSNGQVGIGSTAFVIGTISGHIGNTLPLVNLGVGVKVTSIVGGFNFNCVLISTINKVKCFGNNLDGQLGYGDTTDRGLLSSQMGDNLAFVNLGSNVQVGSLHSGSSAHHVCAILSAPTISVQRIKCWGDNGNNQLGYGDANDRGTSSSQMGDNLLFVDLGIESKVKQLALGRSHTCAILASDGLKCWGTGFEGQLSLDSVLVVNSVGNNIPIIQLDIGKTIKQIVAGEQHTCILYDDQTSMKCVGNNKQGQLGQGDTLQRGTSSDTIYPSIPNINLGTDDLKITSIYSGDLLNCAVFVDSSVKCFGKNNHGEFAIGTREKVGDKSFDIGKNMRFSVFFTRPTTAPSNAPTFSPTIRPTEPTLNPTKTPTSTPTSLKPTKPPSRNPTTTPSSVPTRDPTLLPTAKPSKTPIAQPTSTPTTLKPSKVPSFNPTKTPKKSAHPTLNPTLSPDSRCNIASMEECRGNIDCTWLKIRKKGQEVEMCVVFDCLTLTTKKKCKKEKSRCQWISYQCTPKQ